MEPFIIQDPSRMDMVFITTRGLVGDSPWELVTDGYISVQVIVDTGDAAGIDMAIVMGTEVGPVTDIGMVIRQEGVQGTGRGTNRGKEAVTFMEEGQMVFEAPVHGPPLQIVPLPDSLQGVLTSQTMCIQIETATRISVITMAAGNSGIINPAIGKTTTGRIQEAGIGLERKTARTVTRVPLHSKTAMWVLRIEVLKTGVIIPIRITRIETGVHNGQIAITAVPAGLPEVARVARDVGS